MVVTRGDPVQFGCEQGKIAGGLGPRHGGLRLEQPHALLALGMDDIDLFLQRGALVGVLGLVEQVLELLALISSFSFLRLRASPSR
jgi:hypothetical protein